MAAAAKKPRGSAGRPVSVLPGMEDCPGPVAESLGGWFRDEDYARPRWTPMERLMAAEALELVAADPTRPNADLLVYGCLMVLHPDELAQVAGLASVLVRNGEGASR